MEFVELFRKVGVQLQERAAIKEEKKIEAAWRGTFDSLLKLLRKHSVNQKKDTLEADLAADQLEKCSTFDDDQNLNPFATDDIDPESSDKHSHFLPARPASNCRQKSPVPIAKFQPVFLADEENKSPLTKSQGKRKRTGNNETEAAPQAELTNLLGHEGSESSNDQSETSDSICTAKTIEESRLLDSLKVAEARDLAKAPSVRVYSKLKKGELIELLGVLEWS